MPSVLNTKDFGQVTFEMFFSENNITIGKLANGMGYAYTSGLMVQSKKELDIIPPGPERDEAYYWWEHKDDIKEAPRRKIVIDPDTGGFSFDDGSPITDYSDITMNIPPGPLQNAALDWFSQIRQGAENVKVAKETPAGEAAVRVAGEAAAPKAAPKKKAPPKKKAAPKATASGPTQIME